MHHRADFIDYVNLNRAFHLCTILSFTRMRITPCKKKGTFEVDWVRPSE